MPFFSARPTAVFNLRSKKPILPFLIRQVITTGYVAAGYANSVAWRNVNSINQSTDTTTNWGDILSAAANYTSGAHNRNNAFVWGTNGTGTEGVGAFTSTGVFNMRNNTTQTKTSQMNTANTCGDSGTMLAANLDGDYTYSYQNGGQGAAQLQKFNLVTEAHQGVQSTSFDQGGTGASAHFSENFGYFWAEGGSASADANANGKRKLVFATDTETTPGNIAWHGQQKGLVAKNGEGFGGNEGGYDAGYNFRVWNYTTETLTGTTGKMVANSGEENYAAGQTAGYLLGMYGAPGPTQNNRAGKIVYSTRAVTEFGASGQPSGTQSGTGSSAGSAIAGRSSGHGFWRD